MMRKKIYCLILAIISTVLLSWVTFEFILQPVVLKWMIPLMYFGLISSIFVTCLNIIEGIKRKENLCLLAMLIDGSIAIVTYLFVVFFENKNELMKKILCIVFLSSFVLLFIIWYIANKFEKKSL